MQTAIFLGISGEAVFYTALYFYYLSYKILGFDITKNNNSKNLEKLGAKIIYKNPDNKFDKAKVVIYSSGIPNEILLKIKKKNNGLNFVEVGKYTNNLLNRFEDNKLSKKEREAFHKSNIAPLYNLDLNDAKLIGITGTDGKTTTSEMLYFCLTKAGFKVALVSTLGVKINGKTSPTGLHTSTPSPHTTYKLINQALKKRCKYIIVESTSQGLYMGRLQGLNFDIGAITNVTKEHLDYHKTYSRYLKAKSLLISKYLKNRGTSIINYDDKKPLPYINKTAKNIFYYTSTPKKIKGVSTIAIQSVGEKTKVTIRYKQRIYNIVMPFFESYNVQNALCVIGICINLKVNIHKVIQGIENFKKPLGRGQVLISKPIYVIVDFAHTPNALNRLLIELNKLKKIQSKIICVFGCAGQRDTKKRSLMGKISAQKANITILTAEDPRFENLKEINNQIQNGFVKAKTKNILVRFDNAREKTLVRKNAIKYALAIAKKGDIVVICGKGHEESMCFKNIEYKWNDVKETTKLLKQKYEWNT